MKKALPFLLALTLLFAAPARAADLTPSTPSGTTVITATVGVSYVLTIPVDADIPLNATSTDIGDIALTSAALAPGTQLTVTVTASPGTLSTAGAGAMVHETSAATTLAYTLKLGGVAGNSVAFTTNGTKQVDVDITAAAWNAALAGKYASTLTFTAGVDPIP